MIVLKNKSGYQAGLIETTKEYFDALGLNRVSFEKIAEITMDPVFKKGMKDYLSVDGKVNVFHGPSYDFSLALGGMLYSACDGENRNICLTSDLFNTAKMVLSTLHSAKSGAKKFNRDLVISGRDGFLFFLAAKALGIGCWFLPGWSSNTDIEYPYGVIKKLGLDPFFVDTGYAGSLFIQYEKMRQIVEPSWNAKFVLISTSQNAPRGKDSQSRLGSYSITKGIPLNTKSFYNQNGLASTACGIAETLNHPVKSGDEKGINIHHRSLDGWDEFSKSIVCHMAKVIVIYYSMIDIISNKKKWR